MTKTKLFQKTWIEALKSGKFRQAQGALRKDGNKKPKFCCLGLACVINNQLFPEEKVKLGKTSWGYEYDGEGYNLPPSVYDKLQLSNSGQSKLIDINDEDNCSFKKIAAELENNPEKYFKLNRKAK